MGKIRTPIPAKLFFGLLTPEPELLPECIKIVAGEYGSVDLESRVMPWEITEYYEKEMGKPIFRKFIFLEKLIEPGALAEVKQFTNEIEERYSSFSPPDARRRRVNIDPGYVTEAKVVLATTKDFSHRIYIGGNIYAEVTLKYGCKDRSFSALDHTYFDFRTDAYKEMFNQARDRLRQQLGR